MLLRSWPVVAFKVVKVSMLRDWETLKIYQITSHLPHYEGVM
jgi:hypothetical protein